jgi:hypothetical protein
MKISCAFILAYHKGFACMLNTFKRISFNLRFLNDFGLHNVHRNANE